MEQLFITAIVKTELGHPDLPAVYLWNQPATVSNFTPAWDYFKVTIIIDNRDRPAIGRRGSAQHPQYP